MRILRTSYKYRPYDGTSILSREGLHALGGEGHAHVERERLLRDLVHVLLYSGMYRVYRVIHMLEPGRVGLGWVDLDFGFSPVGQILLGLI